MLIRDIDGADLEAVCDLVDADRLPGQPPCRVDKVQNALAGRAEIDVLYWQKLGELRSLVATSGTGELHGAGSLGIDHDGVRYLLWLHTREDPRTQEALLAELLAGTTPNDPMFAFWFSTPMDLGLEGLPRKRRPRTHAALLRHGFNGKDLWLYMRTDMPTKAAQLPYEVQEGGDTTSILVPADGPTVARAEVAVPAPGIGVLWWLQVDEEHRGRGYGREALRAGREVMERRGATQCILFVDHGYDQRDPAIVLYRSEGFVVVDHLWSYWRGPVPPDA